jgi:UDP-3-O-[3-hydroxymyristoyl] glucosamine N-acyltransferase
LQPGQYSGFFPIDENARWEKNAATLRQLHALRDRVRALEHRSSAGSLSTASSTTTDTLPAP